MNDSKLNEILKSRRQEAIDNYEKNPNICLHCNHAIPVKDYTPVSETRRKKFCDRVCMATYHNIKRYGIKISEEDKGPIPPDVLSCRSLQDILSLPRETLEVVLRSTNREKTRFTNLSQLKKDESLTISQIKQNTKNSAEFFNFVRSWARYKSLIYGMLVCEECGYNVHVEIAHIKAISDFPEDGLLRDINNRSNLKALCPRCHWESSGYLEDFYVDVINPRENSTLGELRSKISKDHGTLLMYGVLRAHCKKYY